MAGPSKNAVRIGEPESLVKPGDPVPDKPGHVYEAGQYAPSPERLSAIKVQESLRAGLLPKIFEYKDFRGLVQNNGEINVDKLKTIDFTPYFKALGFSFVDSNLPQFAAIGLLSSLYIIHPSVIQYSDISGIIWVANIEGLSAESIQEQMNQVGKDISIYKRNAIVGSRKREKEFDLVILQPYFVYMSVPVVPGVPGASSGLSVATYATLKVIGALLAKKLKKRHPTLWINFLEANGWKLASELRPADRTEYLPAGAEIGIKRKTKWLRKISVPPISVNSVISPEESFSEAYVYYWTHRQYMEKVNKDVLNSMKDIIEYVAEVV